MDERNLIDEYTEAIKAEGMRLLEAKEKGGGNLITVGTALAIAVKLDFNAEEANKFFESLGIVVG